MKQGQILEGSVCRADFPNKGIVQTDDEFAVVKNCLPGQKIRYAVTKVRKGKAEGRLLEVIEKSPMETGSPCSLFGICGGCSYLSLPYEKQLEIKEQQVKKLLDSVLCKQKEPYEWEGILGSPKVYEYRNKMEFTFGDEYKDGPLALGMHKRGGFYDIVTVSDCKIVDEDYRTIVTKTRDFFAERQIPYYHRLRHEGFLRHLLVRKASGTGEILVGLVTSSQKLEKYPDPNVLLEEYKEFLLNLEKEDGFKGKFAGIIHIWNDSLADAVKCDQMDILYGEDIFREKLLGLQFDVSTFSFFQTNSYSAEVLYETTRKYVGDIGQKEKVVYDLYCGTGTITQLVAKSAKKVVGVEIVEEAVEAARENAKTNGIENCEFIAGDVLKVLDDLTNKPDMIILDPPRDGIHPKALPKILAYGVDQIVYVSCKPTSLVRDLDEFLNNGYIVKKAVCVDQFPWTTGIETIALIERITDTQEHI